MESIVLEDDSSILMALAVLTYRNDVFMFNGINVFGRCCEKIIHGLLKILYGWKIVYARNSL